MNRADANELHLRFEAQALEWRVKVEDVRYTASSIIAFGRRDQQPVVLKVTRRAADEWHAGQVLNAFGGRGVVRALEQTDGAVLLERLVPGTCLVENGNDDEATSIIADVIRRMSPGPLPVSAPTIESWSQAFDRYLEAGALSIPRPMVETAQNTYRELCASQATTRLLHGDLHHHNVLFDSRQGWVAIDPKGVVGELAYEVGAALRNPCERAELLTAPTAIRKRVDRFSRVLELDATRVLGWAFAQAVLAAIWEWEDHGMLNAGVGWIALAQSIQAMPEAQLLA